MIVWVICWPREDLSLVLRLKQYPFYYSVFFSRAFSFRMPSFAKAIFYTATSFFECQLLRTDICSWLHLFVQQHFFSMIFFFHTHIFCAMHKYQASILLKRNNDLFGWCQTFWDFSKLWDILTSIFFCAIHKYQASILLQRNNDLFGWFQTFWDFSKFWDILLIHVARKIGLDCSWMGFLDKTIMNELVP